MSAPRDAAPSKAFSSSMAVFHFFLGLPLIAIIFIYASFVRIPVNPDGITLVAHGDLLKSSFITQECLGN